MESSAAVGAMTGSRMLFVDDPPTWWLPCWSESPHNGGEDVLHRLDHNAAAKTKTIEYLRLEQDRMLRRCMQLRRRRSWVVVLVPRLLLRRWRRCVLAGLRKWLNSSEILECRMAIGSGDVAEQR